MISVACAVADAKTGSGGGGGAGTVACVSTSILAAGSSRIDIGTCSGSCCSDTASGKRTGTGMGVGVFTTAMGGVRLACVSIMWPMPVYMGGALALLMLMLWLAGALVALVAVGHSAFVDRGGPASGAATTSTIVHAPDSKASSGAEVMRGAGGGQFGGGTDAGNAGGPIGTELGVSIAMTGADSMKSKNQWISENNSCYRYWENHTNRERIREFGNMSDLLIYS